VHLYEYRLTAVLYIKEEEKHPACTVGTLAATYRLSLQNAGSVWAILQNQLNSASL